jgi:phage virion morphogenesis protein
MRVDIDVTQVLTALKGTLDRIKDTQSMWESIGFEFTNSIDKTFDEEGRPEKWQALKPNYLKRKGEGYKILGLSGDLRRAVTSVADPQGVTVGVQLPYAALHQFGGRTGMAPGPAAVVARPYLVIQDEDWAKFADIIEEFLKEGW